MSRGRPSIVRLITDVVPEAEVSIAPVAVRPSIPSPFPELTPVISLAVDAVVYIFDFDEEADGAVIEQVRRAATDKTVELYTSLDAIAARSAEAVRRSRQIRAAEVARVAEAMATRVAQVAVDLQVRDEAGAAAVATDAAAAAERVAAAGPDRSTTRAAEAAQIASEVRAAAASAVRERARQAALLARTAAAAAHEVVQTAELENMALELETSATAEALRRIALETCYQTAIEAAATEAEEALRIRSER